MRNKNVRWITLLLAAFVCITTVLKQSGWLFYEAVDDPQHKLLTEGVAYKCYGFYNLFHLFSYHVLKPIAAVLTILPVYDLIVYGALFGVFVNLNLIFYRIGQSRYNFFLAILLFALMFECIAFINSTRISLLLSFSCVVILGKLMLDKRLTPPWVIYLFMGLFTAADFRLEASVVGVLIGLVFFVLNYSRPFFLLERRKYALFVSIVVLSLGLNFGYTIYRDITSPFKPYSEVEAAITNCIDRKYTTISALPDTGIDGILKTAAMHLFIADKQVFGKDAMSKITSVSSLIPAYHFNIRVFTSKFILYCSNYAFILLAVFISCCLSTAVCYGFKSKELKKFVLFFAFIFLLSLAILWYLKMERRLMIPLVFTVILYCMYSLHKSDSSFNRKFLLMLLPLVSFWVADGAYVINNFKFHKLDTELNEGIKARLYAEHINEVIAIDYLHAGIILPSPLSITDDKVKFMSFDSPYILPGTQLNCGAEYAGQPYISFFNELVEGQALFIMDADKTVMLTEYFKTFYSITYKFKPLSKVKYTNANGNSRQLVLWMVERI